MTLLRYGVDLVLTGLMLWGFFSGINQLGVSKQKAIPRFLLWAASLYLLEYVQKRWPMW